MKILTRNQLATLLQEQDQLCVSLYLPTHRMRPQLDQDRIRFKNLLREAESSLKHLGLKSPAVNTLLAPAEELLGDTFFWSYQSDGLVVFLSDGAARHYQLPVPVQELAVVGRRFHTKPLFPLMTHNGVFYVLALGLKHPRLLQSTRYSSQEIPLEDAPSSLEEALQFDDPEKQLQFHTRTGVGKGRRSAMFHGQGVGVDEAEHKKNVLRYFHDLDKGVHEVMKEENAPLILAAVEYQIALYKEANSYPHVTMKSIATNPDDLSDEELQARAWEIIRPDIMQGRKDAVDRYRVMLHADPSRVSDTLHEILPASHLKRVEKLLVSGGEQRWGKFDPKSGRIEIHQAKMPGDEDLLDTAAAQTFLNGGEVFVLGEGETPGRGGIAAIFRY